MEWVETTGKTLEEAKDRALDQLGVAADEAEFEILEEPRAGLFGRRRGEARVRARIMPASVRPKQDRRSRSRGRDGRARDGGGGGREGGRGGGRPQGGRESGRDGRREGGGEGRREGGRGGGAAEDSQPATPAETETPAPRGGRRRSNRQKQEKEQAMAEEHESESSPAEVGDAAVAFMSGLAAAFGAEASTSLVVDGSDLEVRVDGTGLGLLVGPGGRTLMAVQDLARVASQRRLGDHDTRLRVDVGGYREKRRAALEQFALAVANQVRETGTPKALEPMQSADRKVVHDALIDVDGVSSRSEGDEPMRRVVISPS